MPTTPTLEGPRNTKPKETIPDSTEEIVSDTHEIVGSDEEERNVDGENSDEDDKTKENFTAIEDIPHDIFQ